MPATAIATAEGVHHVANPLVNWYLVEADDGLTAIDAGFPPEFKRLEELFDRLGRRDLKAVVLTHGHVDHVGFAARAHRELGATIYVPEGDVKIATSPFPMAKSEANPLSYLVRYGETRKLYLGALLQGAVLGQAIESYETYRGGDVLPVPGRPHAVACPGHTFGHCALHLPDRDVLFTGDALVTFDPYTGRTCPCMVARAATADAAMNLRSLDALEATGARTVLTGHGDPWTDGAEEAVAQARRNGSA